MAPIALSLRGIPVGAAYRVAGRDLVVDAPLAALAPFAQSAPGGVSWPVLPSLPAQPDDLRTVYHGPGWVGDRWRRVHGRVGGQGYRLDIEGVGALAVSGEGTFIRSLRVEPSCGPDLLTQAALGPALILALALGGAFCLHASAVALDGRAVALLGDSQSGKSTLARYLDTRRDAGWHRIADDILPVEAPPSGRGLEALPHYPQLKLPPDRQPACGQPERVPLAAIVVLDSPGPDAAIRAERSSARQATLSVARHTVAARLFDEALLAQHLALCAAVASGVPVWRLCYPRRYALLPALGDLLAKRLGACEAAEAAA